MCLVGTKVKQTRIAVIGAGSIGGALIDMFWREKATHMYPYIIDIIDPDVLEGSNLSRHVLREGSLGLSKAKEMAKLYRVAVRGYQEKFNVLPSDVDVICSCVDSLACESQINAYA